MDNSLRLVSYIADIGDILVLMTRRRSAADEGNGSSNTTESSAASTDDSAESITRIIPNTSQQPPSKVICHLFESGEVRATEIFKHMEVFENPY